MASIIQLAVKTSTKSSRTLNSPRCPEKLVVTPGATDILLRIYPNLLAAIEQFRPGPEKYQEPGLKRQVIVNLDPQGIKTKDVRARVGETWSGQDLKDVLEMHHPFNDQRTIPSQHLGRYANATFRKGYASQGQVLHLLFRILGLAQCCDFPETYIADMVHLLAHGFAVVLQDCSVITNMGVSTGNT
ncbi:hypothetical protein AJ79_00625 [Helicocarpus griseus UAMH5409]|uniref:Uncharacterized protein n=1 Tax=Helicocarpus griseus UAMH5409 TaxID=1447875 RepID=A0A2B7Y9T4_9EURO|nr:hypothetical protein AJ79_00625 [Helicocarpus griseus UAMH5409]